MPQKPVDLSQFDSPGVVDLTQFESQPVDLTQLAGEGTDLSQLTQPSLPPEGQLSIPQQWAKKLVGIRDRFVEGGQTPDIPIAKRGRLMGGAILEALGLPFKLPENVLEETARRMLPGEAAKPLDMNRLLTPDEEQQPLAGKPLLKLPVDLAAMAIPLGYPAVKGAQLVKRMRDAYVASQEGRILAKAAEHASQFIPRGTALEIPEKASETISGTRAATGASAELGPQAKLIPSQIFEPTEPQVRAAQQIGPLANVIPDRALGEVPGQISEARRIQDQLEKTKTSIEALNAQLKATREAGIPDPRTEAQLRAALSEAKRTSRDLSSQLKELGPEKVTGPKDQATAMLSATPPPVNKVKAESEAKSSIKTLFNYVRESNRVLREGGYSEIPDMVREASRLGDKFENKYMAAFANIYKKFGLNIKGRDEAVARILNGEGVPDQVLGEAARQIRGLLDSMRAEVVRNPEAARLTGPIGYLKDYFPHLQNKLMEKYNDPNTVVGMVHDLLPPNLKASFFKERSLDAIDYNKNLKEVFEAYVRGSRKTLYDLPVYDKGMTLAQQIPDVHIKSTANDFLRNYVGQPSAHLGDMEHNAAQWVARQLYRSYIGFNPFSIGTNLTQSWFNTVPAAGFKATGKGLLQMIRDPKKMRKLAQEGGVLEGYPQLEELALGMGDDFAKTFIQKLDDKLFWGFKKSEEFNRILANAAGRNAAMAKGVKDPTELERAGYNMAADTQFLYGKKAPIPFTRENPLMGQFSNFPLKQAGFTWDMMKKPATAARLAVVYGLPATLTYMNMAPGTPEEKTKAMAKLALDYGRDVLPLPSVGAFPNQVVKANDWLRGVANGTQKATPAEIIENVIQWLPAYRSIRRIQKMGLKEGEKQKPLLGLAGGDE